MTGRKIILIVVAGLSPWVVHGLGIRIPDQDARAVGRGNAFVATADNPSAIYYNPAGLTQLDGHQARVGAYAIRLRPRYESEDGRTTKAKAGIDGIPQLYYGFGPEGSPIAVGAGVYSPYGLSLEWPEDSGFRTLAIEGRFAHLVFSPVAAWQPHPNLSIGAGPTVDYAETKLRRGLFPPGDEYQFRGDDTDFGYVAGLLWRPHRQHAFGVTYRSIRTFDLEGTARAKPLAKDGNARARFKLPQNIVAGWSYRPTPNWNFEFNADWTDWERLDEVTVRQSFGDDSLPFFWESSWIFELGATRSFDNGLSASAGYMFSENSVPDEGFGPLVPDADRHVFSLGLGWQYQRFQGDIAYQLAYSPTREVRGSPERANPANPAQRETADGDYDFLSHAIAIVLQYSF